MTIATTATATPGNYSVVVTGTSGSLSHSTTISLTIGSNFQLASAQPFPAGADSGSQQTAKISITPNYTGSVIATCNATALSGTQCTLTPPNPIAISGSPVMITAQINIPSNAAPGPYSITVNVQDAGGTGAASQSLTIPFTVIQDFTLGTLTPSTQTINAGQSASYNFSVLPIGASFTNAVTLSCSGAPAVSLCSFTPSPITPGSSAAAVVLSITTTGSSSSLFRPRIFYALWLLLPALSLLGIGRSRKTPRRVPVSLLALFLLGLSLSSCGGGGSNGGGGGGGGGGSGQQQGTQAGTYTITVTGSSGALTHQAPAITLIVN
jgi:hypothetical protein